MDSHGGWILEVDIRKFFDTLDHAHLREFLKQRVRDGVLTRLIGKWLQAGVLEDGTVTYPEAGSSLSCSRRLRRPGKARVGVLDRGRSLSWDSPIIGDVP